MLVSDNSKLCELIHHIFFFLTCVNDIMYFFIAEGMLRFCYLYPVSEHNVFACLLKYIVVSHTNEVLLTYQCNEGNHNAYENVFQCLIVSPLHKVGEILWFHA